MTLTGLKALQTFCAATGFNGEIWLQISWQHEGIDPPSGWKLKQDGSPVNYIYSGQITTDKFTVSQCRKRNDKWQPSVCKVDGYSHLRELAELGATIYFYPNQPSGGIHDDNVASSNLLFYEIDNLPLEQQWQRLNDLIDTTGLKPSAVIFTGSKSLHVYFKLSSKVTPENWKKLNRKLAIIQQSDPAICNPARAMRLPGMVRRKSVNGELLPAIDISLERYFDAVYTPEDFEKALDSTGLFPYGLSQDRWLKWRRYHLAGEADKAIAILRATEEEISPKYEPISHAERVSYGGELIPLEWCLSRDDKQLLANGAGEGNRDNAAYKLARNLIGTANQLRRLGYNFSGDPETLFNEFCSKCSPSLPERDRQRIWKSANRGTPTSSLPTAIIEDIVSRYVGFKNKKFSSKKINQFSESEWQAKLGTGKSHEGTDKNISQELWEYLHGIPGLFKKELAKIRRKFRGADREKQKNLLKSKIDFEFSEYQNRADLVVDVLKDGFKYVQFSCHGGLGKSFFAGFLNPVRFKEAGIENIERVVYISRSGRDLPTKELEANFPALPIAHNGLAIDPTKKTPSGKPLLVHPTADNPAVTQSTCHLATKRQELGDNFGIYGRAACQRLKCPYYAQDPVEDICGNSVGNGYGARHLKQVALMNPRFSCNIKSVPNKPEFLAKTLFLIDEPEQIISGVEKIEDLGTEDIGIMQAFIMAKCSNQQIILDYLTEFSRVAFDEKLPYHGVDIAYLRDKIKIPEDKQQEILEACKLIEKAILDRVTAKTYATLPKIWLTKLFSVLTNTECGAIRLGKTTIKSKKDKNGRIVIDLKITTIDERFREIINGAAGVVFLDGTATKQSLADLIGCFDFEIFQLERVTPDYSNQKVLQITGLDNCGGATPSPTMLARMNAIATEARKRYGADIPILSRGGVLGTEKWWVDNRLQNRDAGKPARLSFGTPIQNIGDLQDRFITLQGKYFKLGRTNKADETDPELQAEIDRSVQAEFLQDLWRQRAHRHPDKQFTQIYVTDFDLSFLQDECPGLQIETIDAFAFSPDAGDDFQQTKWLITQAVKELVEAGVEVGKIRQKDILAKAGIGIDWLKKICSAFGGWSQLKKGVVALLKLYSATTPAEEDQLDQDQQWFLDTWLPLQAKEIKEGNLSAVLDVGVYVATYGIKAFEKLCRFLDPSVRADILTGILSILPTHQLEQLLEESIT